MPKFPPLRPPPGGGPLRRGPIRRSLRGVGRGIGWLAAGPVDWMGVRRIRRGASFIGYLLALLRAGPVPDPRFRTDEGGRFDREETAQLYGMTVEEYNHRLRQRRRQTARLAYVCFGLGLVFLAAWVWQALSLPFTAGRVVSGLEMLPFCAVFFLASFHNALLNYQIRVGRLAGWREYLATTEPFLPR